MNRPTGNEGPEQYPTRTYDSGRGGVGRAGGISTNAPQNATGGNGSSLEMRDGVLTGAGGSGSTFGHQSTMGGGSGWTRGTVIVNGATNEERVRWIRATVSQAVALLELVQEPRRLPEPDELWLRARKVWDARPEDC